MKRTTVIKYQSPNRPYIEPVHVSSAHDAGNGHGTVRRWPPGKTLDHPVLDGSTQSWKSDHDTENPWRGLNDPGLIVHPKWGRKAKWHWFWE
ncbi:MAG: hypothetical protein ACTIJ6_11220 [Leucobacter sp.]